MTLGKSFTLLEFFSVCISLGRNVSYPMYVSPLEPSSLKVSALLFLRLQECGGLRWTFINLGVWGQSVQLLSRVRLFATPWTAARQASLSISNSWSLFKLRSIELVMPSNHLILCHPLLLPPSIFQIHGNIKVRIR